MPERFRPVAYADSKVGDVPVGLDLPSTSNLEYNPLRGGGGHQGVGERSAPQASQSLRRGCDTPKGGNAGKVVATRD